MRHLNICPYLFTTHRCGVSFKLMAGDSFKLELVRVFSNDGGDSIREAATFVT